MSDHVENIRKLGKQLEQSTRAFQQQKSIIDKMIPELQKMAGTEGKEQIERLSKMGVRLNKALANKDSNEIYEILTQLSTINATKVTGTK